MMRRSPELLQGAPLLLHRRLGPAECAAAARSLGSSRCFGRKPFIHFADGIFSVVAFEFANYQVRPRHLLEVVNERVVDRCAAECADNIV